MSQFSDNVGNDSFDDILANIVEPTTTAPQKLKAPSDPKKARFSMESDDGISDSLLASIDMPTEAAASTSAAKDTGKAVAAPISAGATNCVLVNPKQRGKLTTTTTTTTNTVE